jgi:hypothetical protein
VARALTRLVAAMLRSRDNFAEIDWLGARMDSWQGIAACR